MKAIVKMPCEDKSCKHEHEMLVDSEELGLKINERKIPQGTITEIPEMQVNTQLQQEPQKITHEDMAKQLPRGVNFGRCKDGSCGAKIKNPILTTKFKTCPNCERNAVPLHKKDCPFCGKKPESSDEWGDEEDISDKLDEEIEEDENGN